MKPRAIASICRFAIDSTYRCGAPELGAEERDGDDGALMRGLPPPVPMLLRAGAPPCGDEIRDEAGSRAAVPLIGTGFWKDPAAFGEDPVALGEERCT